MESAGYIFDEKTSGMRAVLCARIWEKFFEIAVYKRQEFDRTPLIERLQAKLLNINFVINVLWYIFRLLFLIGVSYVILFPFFAKISASFMSCLLYTSRCV